MDWLEYTPQSDLTSPRTLIRSILKGFTDSRHLALSLSIRDLTAKYRQTAIGYLWQILIPVLTTCTFLLLNRANIIQVGETPIPYVPFVFCGTVFWQLFVESVNMPLKKITACKTIFTKIQFPHEAIILSGFMDIAILFTINFSIMLVAFFALGFPLTTGVFFVLPIILVIVLLGFSLGLVLAPVGTLYTDLAIFLSYFLNFWFFLTPIIYPASTSGRFASLLSLNPVTPLITGARDLITLGLVTNPGAISLVAGVAILIFTFSLLLYRVAIPLLVERTGG